MKIVAGLGNPGPRYETTRHNVGFLAVDRLVDRWSAKGPAVKHEAEVYEASAGGEKVLVVKPQTFMNLSGRSIAPLMRFYKCEPTDLVVLYDDLDLDPLALRIRTGGGTGGHNGLRSIHEHLGEELTGYHRLRIGIGHPGRGTASPDRRGRGSEPVDYVLEPFSDDELARLDGVLDEAAEAVELILKGRVNEAMNKFNKREK